MHTHADGGHQEHRRKTAQLHDDTPALLSAPVSFKDTTTATDDKLMDLLWGKDKVRSARNDQVHPEYS